MREGESERGREGVRERGRERGSEGERERGRERGSEGEGDNKDRDGEQKQGWKGREEGEGGGRGRRGREEGEGERGGGEGDLLNQSKCRTMAPPLLCLSTAPPLHVPLLVAVGLLGHLGMDDDNGAVSPLLQVPLHGLPSEVVHLQFVLLWNGNTEGGREGRREGGREGGGKEGGREGGREE